jgi:hypothetical protein
VSDETSAASLPFGLGEVEQDLLAVAFPAP